MYYFLNSINQKIENKDFFNTSVLCENDNIYSVVHIYTPRNEITEEKINSFEKFEDISYYIGFKVRRDGKVSLTLK